MRMEWPLVAAALTAIGLELCAAAGGCCGDALDTDGLGLEPTHAQPNLTETTDY